MNTIKRILNFSLLPREVAVARRIVAATLLPIMVFYMTSLNFLVAGMMTAHADGPVTAIGSISGTAKVGVELTAGSLTPSEATVSYQWKIASISSGPYFNIGGDSNKYTPVAGDAGKFIKVEATGTGSFSVTVSSAETSAVANGDQSAPAGLVGVVPTTLISHNGKITGTTVAMEYKISTEPTTWTTASDTETTGLDSGTYNVRKKAITGYDASPATDVVVPAVAPQATPTFSPVAGAIAFGTTVTIISAGAEHIYYTTDGSTPAALVGGSTLEYSGVLTIDVAKTIKVIATKANIPDSAVGTAIYTQAASADLTDLAVSGSPSSYTFAGGTYTYNGATVANGVETVTVTPIGAGTITVEGTPVATGVASAPIALTAGVQKAITVIATETGKSAKTYTINITRINADQTAPTGLTGVAPTTVANNDGKITETTTDMDYKASTDVSYSAVTGTEINNLASGTYNVRYAAKAGYNVSPKADVVVPVGPVKPAAPSVTNNDTSDTVSGMAVGMEYNLDSVGYVAYDSTVFNALNFSGAHTLLVRVVAEGINPPSDEVTLTFTKASQTITFGALGAKTYGDANYDVSATATSGLAVTFSVTDNCSISDNTVHITGAGSCTVTAHQAGNGVYNAAPDVPRTFSIAVKTINVTAVAKSKTYGDSDPALTYTSDALVGTDAFSGELTRDAGENVAQYDITQGSLTAGSNYTINFTGAKLTIGTRAVTVTADAKGKTYGDSDPALTYQITSGSLNGGDNFTGSLTRTAGEGVGTHPITQGTLALSSNYALTYVGANLTVSAKTINVTAVAKSKTYGDSDPALTYTSDALVGTDAFSGELTRDAGENVAQYDITQGSLTAGSNYTINFTGAKLTIGTRAVTVTADAKGKTYGDSDPALTYQITSGSLNGGDNFTGSLTRTAGEGVGTHPITQGTLALSSNYALTYVGANLTVATKAITITPDSGKTKVYGDLFDPVLTYTVSPALVVGDSLSGSLSRVSGESVGTYAIGLGSLANSNYAITLDPTIVNFAITAKHITGNFTVNDKTYNGDNSATVLTRTLNSVVGLDDVSLSGGTATFSDANVANGKTVTLVGATLAGAKAGNYVLDSVGDATANIAKADAHITVTPYSVTYDGNPHIATATATGVESSPTDLSGLLTLTGTTHTNVGDYATDSWSFAGNGNYNSASGSTTHDVITKANATCTVTGYDVAYDNTDKTATGACIGAKGETLTGLNLSGTTHKPAGTYNNDAWSFTDSTGNYNNTNGTVNDKITDYVDEAFNTVSNTLAAAGIQGNIGDITTDNIHSFTGLYFEKSVDGVKKGRITFTSALDLSKSETRTFLQDLGSKLDASTTGLIGLNFTGATSDNTLKGVSATIKFYGLDALGFDASTTSDEVNAKLIAMNDDGTVIDKSSLVTSAGTYTPPVGTCEVGGACYIFSVPVAHFTKYKIDDAAKTTPNVSGEATLSGETTQVVLDDPNQNVTVEVASGTQDPTIDVSGIIGVDGTGVLPEIVINSDVANVTIPDGTVINGPAGWDGIISAPTSGTPSGGNAPAGFAVGDTVITLGSPDGTITFDTPVVITLTGVTGAVGYRPAGSSQWTEITNVCTGTYESPTGAPAGGECAISNGTDTKILTYHFTSFGSLLDTLAPDGVKNLGAKYRPDTKDVKLSWDAKDKTIEKVYVYRGTNKNFIKDNGSRVSKQKRQEDTFTDSDVEIGKTYFYKIVTEDTAGNQSDAKVIKITIPTNGKAAVGVLQGTESASKDNATSGNDNGNAINTANASNDSGNGAVLGETVGNNNNANQNGFWGSNWKWILVVIVAGAGILVWRKRKQGKLA